ncbi:MAG: PDZ domain-containing protein, partial [Bacteroidota bacterium]
PSNWYPAVGGMHSLDDVIYQMYHQVAKNGRGYTREDYQGIAEDLAGISLASFFEHYIVGTTSLVPALRELGLAVGLQLIEMDPPIAAMARWGMLLSKNEQGATVIDNLYPDSPAFAAGLSIGDELVAIQGHQVAGNAKELIAYFAAEESLSLHLFHHGKLKEVSLPRITDFQWRIPQFVVRGDMDADQRRRLQAWQAVGGATNSHINLKLTD